MTGTQAAWERIKRYAYQHAHPHDLEQIREDVETVEGRVGGRPVTAPLARTGRQTIDRDALADELRAGYGTHPTEALLDAVLALVQPVEGVTLSPEEARRALWAIQMLPGRRTAEFAALAARLEASS